MSPEENPPESYRKIRRAEVLTKIRQDTEEETADWIIGLEEENKRMARLVGRDTLHEDVLDKRAFKEALDKAYKEAATNNQELSVGVIDLDHFKEVNDRFGHDAGDKVIVYVLELLRNLLRTNQTEGYPERPLDIVGRTGGDEISILLPGITIEDAVVVMQKIRKAILGTSLTVLGVNPNPIPISGSIGLSSIKLGSQTAEELHRQADQAMYASKNGGKNTIAIYVSDQDGGSFVVDDDELNRRVMGWASEGLPDLRDREELRAWLRRKIVVPEISFQSVKDVHGNVISFEEQLNRSIQHIFEHAVFLGKRTDKTRQDHDKFLLDMLYSHYAVVRAGE